MRLAQEREAAKSAEAERRRLAEQDAQWKYKNGDRNKDLHRIRDEIEKAVEAGGRGVSFMHNEITLTDASAKVLYDTLSEEGYLVQYSPQRTESYYPYSTEQQRQVIIHATLTVTWD